MHRLMIGQPTINFEAEGVVGAEGGEAIIQDGGDGNDAPAAFDWGDIDDDLRAVVDGKQPIDALKGALAERDAHKAGATKRREQIIGDLEADDDFAKSYSEKRGLIAAPKDEDGFISLAKSRIGEDAKYEHPEIDGADGDMLGAFSEAARAHGVGPKQYKGLMTDAAAAMKDASAKAAEGMVTDLRTELGDDYDESAVKVDDYLRAIGDEKAGDLIAVLGRFPPAQQKNAFKVLADMGRGIGTSERNGDGSGSGGGAGGGDAGVAWAEAKQMLAENGNSYDRLSADQKETYNAAHAAYKASKG